MAAELMVDAQTLQPLYSFNFTDGSHPGTLTLGIDGNLYGTTTYGGTYGSSVFRNYGYGYGTIFKMTTNGTLTTLVNFNFTNGANPNALTLGIDGNLYGTTQTGGGSGYGTIFNVTSDGILTTLLNFNGTNGEGPGDLTLGSDGTFYGVAGTDRGYDIQMVYNVTTNGTLPELTSFRTDGNNAKVSSNLTLGPDGNLYCTGNYGWLCKLTPSSLLNNGCFLEGFSIYYGVV
jgi:uncharacterized repeat protein (TIGR03803 family)